jgi:hypothetical protein
LDHSANLKKAVISRDNLTAIDGSWNDAAQQSLARFNKYVGTTLDTRLASLDTLEFVQGKSERVCPLICEHGYRPDGEARIRIICKAGLQ